jgi:hypothetical protein
MHVFRLHLKQTNERAKEGDDERPEAVMIKTLVGNH